MAKFSVKYDFLWNLYIVHCIKALISVSAKFDFP